MFLIWLSSAYSPHGLHQNSEGTLGVIHDDPLKTSILMFFCLVGQQDITYVYVARLGCSNYYMMMYYLSADNVQFAVAVLFSNKNTWHG